MKLFYILIPLLMMTSFVSADEPVRERIEWIDIWVTDADKTDLPRVLLVGDSITRGYFGGVEKHLAGKAYCARLTTSKCVSDPTFNDDLKLILNQYKFSVIHFNNRRTAGNSLDFRAKTIYSFAAEVAGFIHHLVKPFAFAKVCEIFAAVSEELK